MAFTLTPERDKQIDEIITKAGGKVLVSRLWMEQKLAYPIKGHRKGAYWLAYFRIDSSKMVKFNRACQLNDTILRNLAIKLDPRLVEPMVAVAKGEVPAASPEGEVETAVDKPKAAAAE